MENNDAGTKQEIDINRSNITYHYPNDRFCLFLNKRTEHYNHHKKIQYFKKTGAGGIIVDSQSGKLLVVRGPIKWSLPKGHLEKGEKYHQCAMREILEETNLNIDIDISDRYIDIKKYIYYIINLTDSNLTEFKTNDPEEIKEVQWLSIDQIRNLNCNRQLEYVVNRWDYIQNIIESNREKVTKHPSNIYNNMIVIDDKIMQF